MRVVILVALIAGGVLAGGCTTSRPVTDYGQCEGYWAQQYLGGDKTVCRAGCLMTSVASAMTSCGKTINGKKADPGVLNDWLKRNGGYSGNMFVWGALSKFGLSFLGWPESSTEIKNHICNNRIVILNVNGGGHWVLCTGYNDNTYNVMDPGYPRKTYSTGEVTCAGVFRINP